MSRDGMKWALRFADIPNPTPPGMPSTHTLRLVLIYLGDHANDNHDGSSWASVETLAEFTGLSGRQVQKCLAALRELGLIAPGDPRVVAKHRPDRRPNVWRLVGVNVGHPEKSDGVKSGPNGVNVVRERGERGSPNLLEEHLQEQERREEPQPKPKRPARPRAVPLPENWDPDIKSYAERSGLPESLVENELAMFRVKRKTSTDWDADALAWLLRKKGWLIEAAKRAPNMANLYGQVALFPRGKLTGETAEQKATRVAAELAAREKRVAEQFARREENDRWRAARAQEPQVSEQKPQAEQKPDDVNDIDEIRARLAAAGYDFGEGATG